MSARRFAPSEPREEIERPWFKTPDGLMQQFEVAKSKTPAHWYLDVDKHWRCFADADVKPARQAPAKVRAIAKGEKLLEERKKARAEKKGIDPEVALAEGILRNISEKFVSKTCKVQVRKDRGKGNTAEGETRFYYTDCGRALPCRKHG